MHSNMIKSVAKKPRKGDAAWSTQKVILRWAIDTVRKVLMILKDHKDKLIYLLDTTPHG